ncbi:hypothetical protein BAL199_13885 [alpha proteobacterium BAL199]|nr:hypothetical protein BAL199_13885 [alpha proteobacterium BAL199]
MTMVQRLLLVQEMLIILLPGMTVG